MSNAPIKPQQSSRLETPDDVNDVDELDGVLVQQQGLVGNGGVFALRDRGEGFRRDHLTQNVLRKKVGVCKSLQTVVPSKIRTSVSINQLSCL